MLNAVTIVVLILGGIGAGVALCRKKEVIRIADRVALGAVFVLLFLLGLDMGSRGDVISNISEVGLEAGMISLAAMLGSLAATSVVWVIWFRKREGEE